LVNLQSFFPKGYELVSVEDTGNLVHLKIKSTSQFSACSKCDSTSNSIHSHYNRTLYDLSILTHGVSITLTCRRFFCENEDYERKVFAERHDDFWKPYARRSLRLNNKIEKIAFTNNAETAAKLIKVLYMPISPSTILRIAKSTEIIITSNYKALGIDDWAYRKGVTYGILICDLETHKPIDY
jgi:transposase